MVGPLGQRQQLAGLLRKPFLVEGGAIGQVVVGDQWLAPFGGFAGVDELLPLLGQALGLGLLKGHTLLLQPHEGIEFRLEMLQP